MVSFGVFCFALGFLAGAGVTVAVFIFIGDMD